MGPLRKVAVKVGSETEVSRSIATDQGSRKAGEPAVKEGGSYRGGEVGFRKGSFFGKLSEKVPNSRVRSPTRLPD